MFDWGRLCLFVRQRTTLTGNEVAFKDNGTSSFTICFLRPKPYVTISKAQLRRINHTRKEFVST
jgi:hypothetical protein